ncbi:unnamed protein product [Lampetra planeri]
MFELMTAASTTGLQGALSDAVGPKASEMADPSAISEAAAGLRVFAILRERPTPQQQLPSPKLEDASKLRRLRPVHQFVAADGDWTAFHCRFEAAYVYVGWTPAEELLALPTALDEDSPAAFFTILEADKATLTHTYTEMAAIYDPRRMCFGVILMVTEDNNITSLQVARGIQTHLDLNDRPAVAASASGPDADALRDASFDRGLEERGAAQRPQPSLARSLCMEVDGARLDGGGFVSCRLPVRSPPRKAP